MQSKLYQSSALPQLWLCFFSNPHLCCPNYYVTAKNFTIATINGVQSKTNGTYGIIRFATDATIAQNLAPSTMAINAVNALSYSGGWTNTEAGIRNCDTVLGPFGNRVIVIITDGNTTACMQGVTGCPCQGCNTPATNTASAAALTARNNNITIISIGIGPEGDINNANLLN